MKRHVSIGLTPWAPGCGAAAIGERRRWITMWSVTPAQALGALCGRLRREAVQLTVRAALAPIGEGADPEVEILGDVPGEPDKVVLAIVAYGLTLDELSAALDPRAAARAAA
ncbi:hypothetical protein BH11PSE1_BH11PSE1_10550 [soil metagenome]